ncbi:Phosphatidyl-N-methylethanolamine N-methyltransferase-like protein [Drosera capensis]
MSMWAAIAILLPFPYYYSLWTHPQKWVDLCGKSRDPSATMARVSYFLKLIQFVAFFSVSSFTWPAPLLFWPLVVAGQVLNFRRIKALLFSGRQKPAMLLPYCAWVRVYQLLGEAGVYYGVRFGKTVPWVSEFPFGYVKDPQYVGSILTLLACLSWIPFQYVLLWCLGYVSMILLELKEDPTTRAKPLS